LLDELQRAADFGDFSAQVAAGFVALTGNSGPPSLFEAARYLTENRHVPYAEFLFKLWEQDDKYRLIHAVIAELKGNLAEASQQYRDLALEGDREAAVRYATLLLLKGEEDTALQIVEPLLEAGDLDIVYTFGDYYLRWKDDKDKAQKYFQKIAPLDSADETMNPWPHFAVAWLAVKAQDWDKVRLYTDEVRQLHTILGLQNDTQLLLWCQTLMERKPPTPRQGQGGAGRGGKGGRGRG
jgi:tetratricopeptide (TPR) repeat protein